MNTLMLVALAVVLLCYCGGRFCPKVLSSNKEVLLGVLVGMALCSFAGLRMEGLMVPDCDKILNRIGGVRIAENQGFAPPTCRGYRGDEQVDTTSDSEWCNNQTNPSDYCIEVFDLTNDNEAINFQSACCNSDGSFKTTSECNNAVPNTPTLKNALCASSSSVTKRQGSAMTGIIGMETASELHNEGGVSSVLAGLRNSGITDFNELCSMDRSGLVGQEISLYDMACGQ